MSAPSLTPDDARELARCVARGGVAVFPSDTVYGLCCDPASEPAARRLYELKGRPPARPAAVMFFALESAMATLVELHEHEREALCALLPGAVTLLLENRERRWGPACAGDPATLGLRVPRLPGSARALAELEDPVMQSSANLSGSPDARSVAELPASLRAGADLVLDAGVLPGTPSTVLDLRGYARGGSWSILRAGAMARPQIERALARAARA